MEETRKRVEQFENREISLEDLKTDGRTYTLERFLSLLTSFIWKPPSSSV
jgi:hypothetical protein